MPEYFVEVNITEKKRIARVEADSKSEARRKARAAEWEEVGDAQSYDVRVVGKVNEIRGE